MLKKYRIPYHLDDPRTTLEHRKIILGKPFLKKIYLEWYRVFISVCRASGKGKYLELGSGGGFLKQIFPEAVTSDILPLEGVDMVVDAEKIPFKNEELGCIMMLNVFHHIPHPHRFLKEAERCLAPGGRVVMIEPANSVFGRWIYKRFHHEPFDENGGREIEAGMPLSHSNQALPYIYFERDLRRFAEDFPLLKIVSVKYHTPLGYLLSGGVSRNALLPVFFFPMVKFTEWLLSPLNRQLGLFCTVQIEKKQIKDR